MNANILILGDSITWGAGDKYGGWAGRLKTYSDKKYILDPANYSPLYILGISGDTSQGVHHRFENETMIRKDPLLPTILIFAIGINDTMTNSTTGKNLIPLPDYKLNIINILQKAKKITPFILFVGLTPVDEGKTNPRPDELTSSYLNQEISLYNSALAEITKSESVDFIDIFGIWSNLNYTSLLLDGLHPNSYGHKEIYTQVFTYLKKRNFL